MSDLPSILAFDRATLGPASPAESGVSGLTLALARGQAGWIRAETETVAVDLACGLRNPESGAVSFDGKDWAALGPDEAAAARGRIGRVFWDTAWLSNLDLDENITLARRHLDPRNAGGWQERLVPLCAAFGLTLAPGLRPAFATRRDLQRAQWVRALLGKPDLLVLENPAHAVVESDWNAFLAAVADARAAGAAVLWVGPEGPRLHGLSLRPDVIV